ncbi:gamma-glutamyl-gamma-aminobutyrate hydrolase family protein [Streptomyces canus]|uniref:gamma-glutamyl-gamma-aminobutyrate hydrolase family protein n=1 Tax=Streptomyces canus TaxID=58343 RepID=UPI0037165E68
MAHSSVADRVTVALGAGLRGTARAADGTVEGVGLPGLPGWFTAVQWHPKPTPRTKAPPSSACSTP